MKPNFFDKFHIGLLACFLLLTAPVSFAADGIRAERVHFKKGAKSAVVEASIKGYETVDYVLGARAGQYMNVSLATKLCVLPHAVPVKRRGTVSPVRRGLG